MGIRRAIVGLGYVGLSRGWGDPASYLASRFADYGYLIRFLRQFRVNCVLDVGANTGGYARLLRRLGYRGHICSFEPNAEAFSALTASFRLDRSWRGFPIALGAKRARAPFHVASAHNESSFLDRPQTGWIRRIEEVEIERLDAVFEDLVQSIQDPRVLLKMDTQGYDMKVVEGASATLAKILALQSEVSVQPLYERMVHYTDALRRYEELGYSLMNLSVVVRGKTHGNVVEYDALMARLTSGDRIGA